MKKRICLLLFLSVLMLFLLVSGVFADTLEADSSNSIFTIEPSAKENEVFAPLDSSSASADSGKSIFALPDFHTQTVIESLKLPFDFNALGGQGAFIAWFFIILIVILVYSALSYVQFPQNAGLRWVVGIAVAFLSIVFIRTDELTSAVQSYRALGIALIIFFPVAILAFFTFVVASKVNPLGIVTQRILWIIYSVYLFFQVGILLLARGLAASNTSFSTDGFMAGLFKFFFGNDYVSTINGIAANNDSFILVILLIVSISTFLIFVVWNKAFTAWLARETMDADMARFNDTAGRARAAREAEAEGTRARR